MTKRMDLVAGNLPLSFGTHRLLPNPSLSTGIKALETPLLSCLHLADLTRGRHEFRVDLSYLGNADSRYRIFAFSA